MLRHLATPAVLSLLIASTASGQSSPSRRPTTATPSARTASASASASTSSSPMTDPYMPTSASRRASRSRTSPYQYADPEHDYGWRNPGGIGRMNEFYPPGNRFQRVADPVRVATFGGGGVPDRQEQLQAQSIGIERSSVLQRHIDAYGSPMRFGYGFGYGGYGFGTMLPY